MNGLSEVVSPTRREADAAKPRRLQPRERNGAKFRRQIVTFPCGCFQLESSLGAEEKAALSRRTLFGYLVRAKKPERHL